MTPAGRAPCRHFGSCGGCSLQDRPYEEQLSLKKEKVLALLRAALSGPLPEPSLHPSPRVWGYRNKMEFSFGDVYPPEPGRWLKLGMKPKGRWHTILDLEECLLPSPEAAGLLAAVRAWAEREGVPPYNSHRRTGTLRHLALREARNRPDRMAVLVCGDGPVPKESLAEAVRGAYPATTLLLGRHRGLSDTAEAEELEVLFGPGHAMETLRFPDGGSLDYRISPGSFFQTNTEGAQVLYGLLRAWGREAGGGLALDLYCGGGGIALSLAGACRKVIGVESNAAAARDAQANAALNGLGNCEFYRAPAEALLPSLLDMGPDFAVADPPRAGLHARAVQALLAGRPRVLLYVSCNPEALARDLAALSCAYRLERLAVVDLFPHTEHVESAALLSLYR